jgi:predicted DNA-binding transcriptional regulator AlpA
MRCATQRPRLATPGDAMDRVFKQTNPSALPAIATSLSPLVTKADLESILKVDKRTIDRMRSAGQLPKPDLMISRFPRWRVETIRAWIENGGR